MAYDGDDPAGLVVEQLNTVAFVMDYVEFGFNGPVLKALTNPVVESGGRHYRFPESGSRDALCSLIGSDVSALVIKEDDRIELVLKRERTLTIPLDRASRRRIEATHYLPAASDGSLRVADMLIW